jgi:diaminohydroxyphosphoribosylaminopyrimidine deaminase/5-amino-6-(5-phosphoribosylamino)uracil reductase
MRPVLIRHRRLFSGQKAVTQFHKIDERFMRVALGEAAKGFGKTSPNPAVGAVLIAKGKIISRGHHRGAGKPHAEIECLSKVSARDGARSTMYLTLEPCSTRGRTGACTKAIIESGIKTVVVGAIDPNPLHNGRGIDQLQNAGIEVRVGVLADECAAINEAFNKWIVTKIPFVIAKCGMSLDGRLTMRPNESPWVTSSASRRDARKLRAQVDAIIVGAETIRADDPQLNVRGLRGTRQPLIVVLTRSGKLSKTSRIFRERTSIYRNKSLEKVFVDLGRKEITSVLIEGGGNVLGQALDARLIDKVQIYLGPVLTGGPVVAFSGQGAGNTAGGLRLDRVNYRKIDNDICATASVQKQKDS